MKKESVLLQIKDLFDWVNSRYSDEKDNLTAKDVEELRIRVRSLMSFVE